jgi:hypothetical protein
MELRVVVLGILVSFGIAGMAQAQEPTVIPLPVIELAPDTAGANVASVIACNPGSTVPGVSARDFCPVDVIVPTDPTVVCIQMWNNIRRVVIPQAQTLGQPTRPVCQPVVDAMGNRLAKVRLHVPRPSILTGSIRYVPQAVRVGLQPLVGTRVGIIPDASFCVFARGLGGTNPCNDAVEP